MLEPKELGTDWSELSEAAIAGMNDWRSANPKASFAEIETELDLRLVKLRARMLQDTALASSTVAWSGSQLGEKPGCPDCGWELAPWGKRRRRLQTLGGKRSPWNASMESVPVAAGNFSPWLKSWNCCRAA